MALVGNWTRFEAAVMTHRCTVERDANLGDGRYAVPDFQELTADQPCFLYSRDIIGGREPVRTEGTVVVDPLKMLVPLDADVKPTDHINGVTDRQSTVILAGVFNITSVLPHHSHKELTLERVTGGA